MTDQPPNDHLAEQSVLGSCLLSKEAIAASSSILKAEHFYVPNHSDIFSAILGLNAEGQPVDPVTVAHELEIRKQLRRIGGGPYLHTLTSNVPTASNAAAYARVVFDKWRQRGILRTAQKFLELGHTEASSTEEVDMLLAEADAAFRELGEPSRTGIMWDDLAQKWIDQDETATLAMPTPWPELNTILHGGIRRGQLVIIGGRPGIGKSNGGLNVSLKAAESNFRTTVFSVEMDDLEVFSRLLAAGSWAPHKQIFTRRMDEDTKLRVSEYIEARKGMPLEVVDQPYLTVEQVVAHCRVRRPDQIFVDYSQLLEASNPRVDRQTTSFPHYEKLEDRRQTTTHGSGSGITIE